MDVTGKHDYAAGGPSAPGSLWTKTAQQQSSDRLRKVPFESGVRSETRRMLISPGRFSLLPIKADCYGNEFSVLTVDGR